MRERLPNRRRSVTVPFHHSGHDYVLTVGFFPDGRLGELFINSLKVGSGSDVNASDAAVAMSLALQHGCSLEELRLSMKRNPDGSPSGPLGRALDEVARLINN